MNLLEAQTAADKAAHRCARLARTLRSPACITSVDTYQLLALAQQLGAAAMELDARVRGVPETKVGE